MAGATLTTRKAAEQMADLAMPLVRAILVKLLIPAMEELRAQVGARDQALEDAAKACDDLVMYEGEDNPAELCARAVRALKGRA